MRWGSYSCYSTQRIIHHQQQPFYHSPPLGDAGGTTSQLAASASSSSITKNNNDILDEGEEENESSVTERLYNELKWLSEEIRRHDELYYNNKNNDNNNNNLPTKYLMITDDDYDALVKREEEICTVYPELQVKWEKESGLGKDATRIGGRVGITSSSTSSISTTTTKSSSTTTATKKRQHLIPMLSLDNVTTKEQVYNWLERIRKKMIMMTPASTTTTTEEEEATPLTPPTIQILTEPKLDGLSLSLRYKLVVNNNNNNNINYYYELVHASTRGDGKMGQDVTQPVVEGMKLPKELVLLTPSASPVLPDLIEIRGEVVLPKTVFLQLRKQQQQQQQQQQSMMHNTTTVVGEGDNQTATTAPPPPSSFQIFSNARNAASGLLLRKQQQPKVSATTTDSEEEGGEEERQGTSNKNSTNDNSDADDDDDDALTTLSLQSMLQFYAYDVVATKNSNDDGQQQQQVVVDWMEDDAMTNREQLQSWGFRVPKPIAITTLEWRRGRGNASHEDDGDNNDDDEEDSEKTATMDVEYESWSDVDLKPMLDYHEALGKHREQMLHQEQEEKEQSTKKSKAKTTNATTKANQNIMTGDVDNVDDDHTTLWEWGDYDMDGCVHKIGQSYQRQLVGNSNRAPRWAVAHKYPSQSAITSLLGIEIQVGRKVGALTPVAILEPVELAGGVTVTRATLHNFQHMQQLFWDDDYNDDESNDETSSTLRDHHDRQMFLARGSKVLVRRAGDVIPQVVQLAEPPKRATKKGVAQEEETEDSWIDLSAPRYCPACGSPAIADLAKGTTNSETASSSTSAASRGQVLRCGGPQLLCPPRSVGALVHAYSRDALDISGLSEARIQQLSSSTPTNSTATLDEDTAASDNNNETATDELKNASMIKLRFPSDVFRIAKDPIAIEAIASLPGWGPKSAQNLADTANRVANDGVSLARFIYSLSIRYAGIHSSKILATAYGNVTAFLDAIDEASRMEMNDNEDGITTNNNNNNSSKLNEEDAPRPFAILADKSNEVNKGIGPSLLSSLLAFSREKELVGAAKELASVIRVHDDEDFLVGGRKPAENHIAENQGTKPFTGMKVVFTGSLSSLKLTRKEAQAIAKSMGAVGTPGTISKSTDIVVVGERGGGKKLDNAKDLGIQIMDLAEFAQVLDTYTNL